MHNKAMERKLQKKEATDLSGLPRTPAGDYVLLLLLLEWRGRIDRNTFVMDFCDAKTEEWIWSIGRDNESGDILASTTAKFYQNPAFECLWLR